MKRSNTDPVQSLDDLGKRVERLLGRSNLKKPNVGRQLELNLSGGESVHDYTNSWSSDVTGFLGFVVDTVPDGEVYLFGGLLRDIALFGSRGFESDVDLVVDGGDWLGLCKYLDRLGGRRNKFGGYRLSIGGWPIDIWNARETWAVAQGLVTYNGIRTLTETTILNWDAVLMNWRTRNFVVRDQYLAELQERRMDVVMEQNPNPKGMAVRVFRHLCLKNAKAITPKAAKFLASAASTYSYQELISSEVESYGRASIGEDVFEFFRRLTPTSDADLRNQWEAVTKALFEELHDSRVGNH